jgi:hypothetical protein
MGRKFLVIIEVCFKKHVIVSGKFSDPTQSAHRKDVICFTCGRRECSCLFRYEMVHAVNLSALIVWDCCCAITCSFFWKFFEF